MKTFIPAKKTIPVPRSEITVDSMRYTDCAWHGYNVMVMEYSQKKKLSLWEAHKSIQAKYPFKAEGDDIANWTSGNCIVQFMQKFKKWKNKTYDLEHLNNIQRSITRDCIKFNMPLHKAFEFNFWDLNSFAEHLWSQDMLNQLKELVDDPIFGTEAANNIRTLSFSRNFQIEEAFRRSNLHDNVKKIDQIISVSNQSSYNVMYPWPPNHNHNIPNCLCVVADGGCIFRLEVLDPETVTHFKLVNLINPWWKVEGILAQCKLGEGEYDFPFEDFNVFEGDVFDLDVLLKVMQTGMDRINTRSERKKALRGW